MTSLPEDSLVSHTAQQENEKAKKMNATCGQKCLEQFEKFNRAGLWARMFAGLLIGTGEWYSTRCRLTWKLSATKCSRFYFQLVPSTPRTAETGYGLLPTVMASVRSNEDMTKQDRGFCPSLLHQVTVKGLLPTPRANEVNGLNLANNPKLANRNEGNLEEVIAKALLPTPTADDNPAKNTGKRNKDGWKVWLGVS